MSGWLGGRPARYAPGQIAEALEASGGNVSRAAAALGTGRSTLHAYLARYPSLRRTLDGLRAPAEEETAGMAPPAQPAPGGGAGRSADTPPPVPVRQGRWLEPPAWAPSGWIRMEVVARGAAFKHYPELLPGDVVAVPPSTARGWIGAGMARPAPPGERGPGEDR